MTDTNTVMEFIAYHTVHTVVEVIEHDFLQTIMK